MERAQRRLESMQKHLLPHPQASAGGIAPEATSAGGADGKSIWQEVPQVHATLSMSAAPLLMNHACSTACMHRHTR